MWATRGLAVALALSVLPGSGALRPGDCEGAGGRDLHTMVGLLEALNPTNFKREGATAAGPSGVHQRKGLENISRA